MTSQASAELGHVGTFKAIGLDGKSVEFKAKTMGMMLPKASGSVEDQEVPEKAPDEPVE